MANQVYSMLDIRRATGQRAIKTVGTGSKEVTVEVRSLHPDIMNMLVTAVLGFQ